jgi:DHA2 family multidrug resistance protein
MTALGRNWVGFSAMCAAMFMAILDIQVVASALVDMGASLHIGNDSLSWIQNAYLTAEIVAIPLTGWLTRSFGLRWLFATATLGFSLASLGCALSDGLVSLIALRVVQGFFGGMLIPSVFSAVFLLLPEKDRVRATTLAGIAAMLAPTLGPLIGGYLTSRFSWHWIFLINVLPGLLVVVVVAAVLPRERISWPGLRGLDWLSIFLVSASLACLELLLKEGPFHHWRGLEVAILAIGSVLAGIWAVNRSLKRAHPFVELHHFKDLRFSLGCIFSFVLGAGLYGSVYLLALFLGIVRGHTPFEIGEIMMVAGGAQLVFATGAAWAETRVDARVLTALGFALFAAGLFMNGFSTAQSDFSELFWPQVLRGAAVMFCLLPATRLALDHQPPGSVADASSLFNLMRNVGGAIGIAGVDTILQERTSHFVDAIVARLQAGDPSAAQLVGLPTERFHNVPMGPIDPFIKDLIEPLVRKAALVEAFNEAWLALGLLFLLSLVLLPAIPRPKGPSRS